MADKVVETIGRDNWEALAAEPVAFLMLGKGDCEKCATWTDALNVYLGGDEAAEFAGVRFGKMLIETPGLGAFKKANPWLAKVEGLPYNLIYVNGEIKKEWSGDGLERLQNRLRRFVTSDSAE